MAKDKLLIVDDDVSFLDLAKTYFKERGIDATAVENSMRALSAMKTQGFKVVILDYQMPQTKGDDLIAILQRVNPKARFIIVTGFTEEHVEHKFKGLGYYAYFEKANLSWKKLEDAVVEAFKS